MSSPHHGGRQGLSRTFNGLATVIAIVGTVFLAPHIWPLIEGQVWVWLVSAYSREVSMWLHPGCQVAMWAFTYLALHLGLSAVFAWAALLITKRMM